MSHPEYLPLYRALVEYAHDVLGVLDLDGRVHYLSPAAAAVFGRKPGEMYDVDIVDYCHPDDRPRYRAWLARLNVRRERDTTELRMGAAGQWRRLIVSGVRVQEDETTERLVISTRDVTREVEAAKALEVSEKRYHGAFDYAPIGKALMNVDGRLTEVNRVFSEMLGLWVSELIGQSLWRHLDDEDAGALKEMCAQIERREHEYLEREIKLSHGDRDVWAWLNISALWGDDAVAQYIVQVQDITARRQAEQALKATNEDLRTSNEELKRFAFIAAHDLREPLRGVSGAVQLIARRYADQLDESGNELAQQAVTGVKKLRALLDDLVTYAEQMRGGEMEQAPVTTAALIKRVNRALKAKIEDSGATLDLGELPTVLGDNEQIYQIFHHLIDNALKFRDPARAPEIHVGAQWTKGVWEFVVRDNGIGIDPEHHGQIFEVFRRLHGDTYEGTGVGLATVKKIVEHHGGRIWVESALGEGSAFHFTLPPQ